MPLVLICGIKKSGKSEVAEVIVKLLNDKGKKCILLKDDPEKDYVNVDVEKMSRGALFSAIERELSKDTVVVVDAMNYIKGFRYQIFCSTKALSTPMCTVWCQGGGDEKEEVSSRFEPPQEKNRWDRPLIIARREKNGKMEFDEQRVWDCVQGTVLGAPNLSTVAEPRTSVHDLDGELNECVAKLLQDQKEGINSGLSRNVTMSELRLWKREYMQMFDLKDGGKEDTKKAFFNFVKVKCNDQ